MNKTKKTILENPKTGKPMTQEERWLIHYNEVKTFIETYHRNPSVNCHRKVNSFANES